ncbi:tyrosine-type recombinase/integrase [Corynebacterium hindlerae]|uniref:Tyrosine-type recombinase/integrase n=1 Tax=Corynebacterium hindlerae TaxID=699041 RepID=A0A7G5FI98_9CORY|nr:site-specific integrase [Corynebacterium hindlerae]QMV86339.1 tyrosine-type recombinase/integrase [Corynebacterium hindlerae]
MAIATAGSLWRDEKRGLWIAEIWCGYDPVTGKAVRPRVTSKDKNEAVRKRRDKIKKINDGTEIPGKSMAFEKWAGKWLDEIAVKKVDVKTMRSYRSCVRCHLVPAFGKMKLDKITPDHIRAMHRAMEDKGLSSRSINAAHKQLSAMLKAAGRDGKMGKNPCDMMDTPKIEQKAVDPFSLAEARAIIRFLSEREPAMAARWACALLLGTRQNETLAFTRDVVDLSNGLVTVDKQLKEMTVKHGCGTQVDGKWPCGRVKAGNCPHMVFDVDSHIHFEPVDGVLAFTFPKSEAGKRVMPLPRVLWNALEWHMREQYVPNEWGLLWVNERGKPIRAGADSRAWKQLLKDVGVSPKKLHAGRHTMVSLMLDDGAPLDLLSPFVGHSSVATTRIYAHASIDAMRLQMDRLGRELEK